MNRVLLSILGAVVLLGIAVAQGALPIEEKKSWAETLQFLLQIGGPLAAALIIGFRNPKELLAKKTTYAGMSIIVGTILAFIAGSVDAPTALYAVSAGLAVIFLKDGQISTEKAAAELLSAASGREPDKAESEASMARTAKRG